MSKKVLFIGDVHGLTEWREIALDALKNFREIVFLGDYVDSFFVRPVVQLDNLKQIISFVRKKAKDKATLLLGNHDYAYIHGYSSISGYQHEHAYQYRQVFEENKDLFKIAWGYQGDDGKYTLATHAGLTSRFWYRNVLPLFEEGKFLHEVSGGKDVMSMPFHEALNYLVDKKVLIYKVGSMRGGVGYPGPMWADYREFIEDPMPGINQVFGHTPKTSISVDHVGDYFYVCCDSWGNKKLASIILSL